MKTTEKTELMLKEYEGIYQVATKLAKATIIPKSFKNPTDAWYAMLVGNEMGLTFAASLNNISIINGRISISADAMMALVMAHPQYFGSKIEEKPGSCTVTLKRKHPQGFVDERTSTYTLDDAKAAGLLAKDNWKSYPKRMLKARAQAYACRDLFPEILSSLLSTEEAENLPAKKVEMGTYEVIEPGQTVEDLPPVMPSLADIAAKSREATELIEASDMSEHNKKMAQDAVKHAAQEKDIELLDRHIEIYASQQPKPEAPVSEPDAEPEPEPEPEPKPEIDLKPLYANIRKGVAVLAKHRIDNYEQPQRVKNSYKKHLDSEMIEDCTDEKKLNNYLNHLREKYTEHQKAQKAEVASVDIAAEKVKLAEMIKATPSEQQADLLAALSEAQDEADINLIKDLLGGAE